MRLRVTLGLLMMVLLAACGAGGGEDKPAESAETPNSRARVAASVGPALAAEVDTSGYALERTRSLPGDVEQQVSYNEGGDPGCPTFLTDQKPKTFVGIHETGDEDDEQRPTDGDTEAPVTGLNDPFEFCASGFRENAPLSVEVRGPRGRVRVEIGPDDPAPPWILRGTVVTLFLDHVSAADIGEQRLTIRQGARTVRAEYSVEKAPPTIRLPTIGEHRAGQPVRVMGSGFSPRQGLRLAVYRCADAANPDPRKRGRLHATVPVSARADGSFQYGLLTRRTDTGCFLIRADDPPVRDGWFSNRFDIRGGRPDPAKVAAAERDGCKAPLKGVEGTSCEQAAKVAGNFLEGLREGSPCLGEEECFISDDYFSYECAAEGATGRCVGGGPDASGESSPNGTSVVFDTGIEPPEAVPGGTCDDIELDGMTLETVVVSGMSCEEGTSVIRAGSVGTQGYQRGDGWTCNNQGAGPVLDVGCAKGNRGFTFEIE